MSDERRPTSDSRCGPSSSGGGYRRSSRRFPRPGFDGATGRFLFGQLALAAQLMFSIAESVVAATPAQLRELVLLLVERAETRDGHLGAVCWTRPARPFFDVAAMAPPDGLEPPTRRSA